MITKHEAKELIEENIICRCIECNKPLTPEEYYYGHDCETTE